MAFSYDFQSQPLLSTVRMMIPDTVAPGIFSDAEVNQAIYIESSQGTYASGQAVPGGNPVISPAQVYSPRRAAALLVDCLAGNSARLAIVEQILDVKIDGSKSAQWLREHAKGLRDTEANSGAFAIAEWVLDPNTAYERVWKQLLRLFPG